MAFVVLTPFALSRRFSHLHWPERWLFPLGGIVGITAYAMSVYSVGGWIERSAVLFYNSLFLFSLGQAWLYKMRDQSWMKSRWLHRDRRPSGDCHDSTGHGVFFATSSITHLAPRQFFGYAFWVGFSINWVVVETYLRSRAGLGSPERCRTELVVRAGCAKTAVSFQAAARIARPSAPVTASCVLRATFTVEFRRDCANGRQSSTRDCGRCRYPRRQADGRLCQCPAQERPAYL